MKRFLSSPVLFGLALFAFSAGFPPFDDVTEVDLTLHMLQHVLMVLGGVLAAYPLFRNRAAPSSSWVPRGALVLASALVVSWHLPVPWDTAVLNPGIHAIEHISFLGVGVLIGSWIRYLSDSAKIGALCAAFFGHMFYAVLLISPWNSQVYPLYNLSDQVIFGWTLLLTGPSLVVGIAYIIAKNPAWLSGFSGRAGGVEKRETFVDRIRVPRWVTPVLTGLLLLLALGYFGMTAIALSGTHRSFAIEGSRVEIVESPVTWQYSPSRIVVVLGINNTVTWVSNSISYDSVTSRTPAFDSGPIPPGGSYSYTFTTVGTYDYYCVYHPWMTGEVNVVP